jgi:hypothetical protein
MDYLLLRDVFNSAFANRPSVMAVGYCLSRMATIGLKADLSLPLPKESLTAPGNHET